MSDKQLIVCNHYIPNETDMDMINPYYCKVFPRYFLTNLGKEFLHYGADPRRILSSCNVGCLQYEYERLCSLGVDPNVLDELIAERSEDRRGGIL